MTKTTLRELSHKYASILRKCAILNAMVLGITVAGSADAAITTSLDENGNTIISVGSGDIYYMPEGGLNIYGLNMTSDSVLDWNDPTNPENKYYGQNGINIDNANFSGKINMGYASPANEYQPDHYVHVMHTTNAKFSDVEVIGHKNPAATANVNWGDYSSFWSNALTLTNNVKMTDTQVGMMSSTEVKTNSFFAYEDENTGKTIIPDYFDIEVGSNKDSKVVYNGGLYKIKTTGSYTNALYNNIKKSVDNGALVPVDVMDQFTPFVGSGITYKAGDVFVVSDTNASLRDAKLIPSDDTVTTIVAYQVKENKTYTSLKPTDMLTEIIKPVSGEAGVSIVGESADNMANVSLYHSSISSFGANTDEAARLTMVRGYEQLRLSLLEKLASATDDKDIDFRNKLSLINVENIPSDFWNKLRLYDGQNKDIITAYKIADATMDQYRAAEEESGALPYKIQYANLEIGCNSNVALETAGQMLVDHSNVSVWGATLSEGETDGGELKLNAGHGSFVIQGGSTINLYANSDLCAEAEGEGPGENDELVVNSSTINLRGTDETLRKAYGITDDTSVGASISSTMGLQLTNGSTLNAIGGTDGYTLYDDEDETTYSFSSANVVYLTNGKLDIDTSEDWKTGVEKKALYVINSEINIGDKNGTASALSLYHAEGEQEGLEGGTIALDMNSEVNLFRNSTLTADIVSLNTDTDAGVVNFYNNSRLNGTIYRANVFAQDKTTKVNGTLALNSATLDIGTNTLDVDTLSLDNSTIATHIDTTGNGTVKAGALSFGKTSSVVKLVVDDTNAISPEGTTIDFMTGAAKEIGDNLTFANIMYDFKYNAQTGQLRIVPNGNSGTLSLKDLNDRLVANTWLSGEFSNGSRAKFIADTLNEWAQTDQESFAKAVKQLKPVDPSVGTQIAGQNNQQVVDVAFNHGNNGNGNNNGRGQGNGKGNNGNAYGHNNGHNPHGRSGGDTFNNVGIWAQGLYNYAKLDGSNGYKGKTKGITMGVDGMLTDNLKLGLAYAYTTTDVDTDTSNTDVDTHTGVLYGEYLFDNAFVNAAGTYSYSKYDGSSSGLLGKIGSDYHMDSIYGQVMTGYHFDVNNNIMLTPEAGLRYLWTKSHAYTDTAEQHIKANTSNTWTGVLGGRISMEFATEKAVFTPEFKLATTYDMKNDNGSSSVRLANGSSYVVKGESLQRFGVETGASMGMTIDNMDFSLSYEGRFKKDYQDHTGMFNFRYNF